ncbi:hypothetical protein KY290_031925 [Solanum tuberosum]|uniref:DUF4283 domain-containing protein n=1 Tax=Solanum tuberosum TaxID=4113 RepID=A0ABQ7UAN2_SOLTU|nr:hypothetical protein KY290_031925 [Solanum tuberosum]
MNGLISQRPTLPKFRSWSSHYSNPFPNANTNAFNYADVLHNTLLQQEEEPTIIKPITFLHGEPTTMWTTKEFDRLIVKVEVDLLKEILKRIQINRVEEDTETVRSKWQRIQYDHLPKYCTHCRLQGHDMQGCRMLHKQEDKKKTFKDKAKGEENKENQSTSAPKLNGVYKNGRSIHHNWNVVQNRKNKGKQQELTQKEQEERQEQHKVNQLTNDIKGKAASNTNKYEALVDHIEDKQEEGKEMTKEAPHDNNSKRKKTTKPWVEASFGKIET